MKSKGTSVRIQEWSFIIYRAKRQLSSQHQAKIEIEAFSSGHDLSETLTRAKFEELNADLFKKTLLPVQKVLGTIFLSFSLF